MANSFLQVRTNEIDKQMASEILENLGTNLSTVVNMLLLKQPRNGLLLICYHLEQFIVMCAVLPILLVIIVQMSLDQINSYKISGINRCVFSVANDSRADGKYDYDELLRRLRADMMWISEYAWIQLFIQ